MASHTADDPNRRDFIVIAAQAFAVVGAAAALWPFIHQMNPDASTQALASTEVDLSPVKQGQAITVLWRGKPVFIRNRTPKEVEDANKVDVSELKDPLARNANVAADAPATDVDRSAGKGKENWLVMIGVCTHLGCVPLGESGEFGGWFCPCHGSVYDTAGRIRQGPAPENMAIPVSSFISDTVIRVG